MTDAPLPGTSIDLPLPPELTETWGYEGKARYVGFYWSPCGDELVYDDSRSSGTGNGWAFLAYRRHRAVALLLAGLPLGFSDQDADCMLLIDRERNRASVAPLDSAHDFLAAQWPPRPPLTDEQREAIQAEFERLLAERDARPIDMEAVQRAMEEQRRRVGRMVSWLDMAPVPPGRGRS